MVITLHDDKYVQSKVERSGGSDLRNDGNQELLSYIGVIHLTEL